MNLNPTVEGNLRSLRQPSTAFSINIFLLTVLAVLLVLSLPGHTSAADPGHRPFSGSPRSISICSPSILLENSISRAAIQDTLDLLARGFPRTRVTLNNPRAGIRIILSLENRARRISQPGNAALRKPALLSYPPQEYRWTSREKGRQVILVLTASSPQGISFGLYGLLQEKLGFKFIHPRQTLIPHHNRWPLGHRFNWEAFPRFTKRGFHLHSLHPTELADQLNNPLSPGALADVKEYLDWLARNQQNIMQFYLLRGIDRDRWPEHARAIVAYAHERGILVGAAVSISMIQQQAFQSITLLKLFPSYQRQVERTLAWLFSVPWDFITLEPAMGEYLPDLGILLPDTSNYIASQISGNYWTPLFLATHVIQRKRDSTRLLSPAQHGTTNMIPARAGILIHTVMNYGINDPVAPVYGNRNQRFMLDRLVAEKSLRETWYWPESSYWISYDSSVPLFLLTYLDARWNDMEIMEHEGIPGHLTFSSGWEWGYWLIDWSIARWSWRHAENGHASTSRPPDCLDDLLPDRDIAAIWKQALSLERYYVKNRQLIRFLAGIPPFAEVPRQLRRKFQPMPAFSYSWLFRRATHEQAASATARVIADLEDYAHRTDILATRLDRSLERRCAGKGSWESARCNLARELHTCLAMNGLRARHRALTLRALLALKAHSENGTTKKEGYRLLAKAAVVRGQALELVRKQELLYRYPLQMIARPRNSLTAYAFGYLYPVSTLFFWEREEKQIRENRFDPFFMNIWDFSRVLGLGSLVR